MSKHKFNELEALQLGQALRGALREQSPLKLTITRCAKEMEKVLQGYSDRKQKLMEEIVVKDTEGNMVPVEGLEKEPTTITDYQLSVGEEEAIKAFKQISEEEVEVELPDISGEAKVLIEGEKVTLEEFLDMDPDASGNLAYVYLTLTE